MDCASLNYNCQMQDKCTPQSQIDQITLDSFFGTNTNTTCNTTYVYLSSRNDGESRDVLRVKQIYDDCNILFTKKNGYYYVYSSLLHQMIIWAADPRSFARQGYLGHHTTIGIKNGIIDMHDTFYGTFKNPRGHMILAKQKTRINYKIDNKHQLLKQGGTRSMFENANQTLWNDICCHQQDIESQVGSGKVVAKPKNKTTMKLINTAYLKQEESPVLRIKQIVAIINKRIAEAEKLLVKFKHGAIAVPYISKRIEKRVLKQLVFDNSKQYILFSHHQNDAKSSMICIDMWMQM